MAIEVRAVDGTDLRQRYEAGATVRQVAEAAGISDGSAYKRLLAAGTTMRPRTVGRSTIAAQQRADLRDEVLRRYAAGDSVKQIGVDLQCAVVKRILTEAGVGTRDASAAQLNRSLREIESFGVRSRKMHLGHRGEEEPRVTEWLKAWLPVSVQMPVGPYSIDVVAGAVAVEVHRYSAHPLTPGCERAFGLTTRLEYLLDRGWPVVYVWTTAACPATPGIANEVVALHQLARSDPAAGCQYRVIRGCGELVFSGVDVRHGTSVRAPRHAHH